MIQQSLIFLRGADVMSPTGVAVKQCFDILKSCCDYTLTNNGSLLKYSLL